MAEFDRGRVAALLAADAELDVRAGLTAQLRRHLDEAADACLIELGERVGFVDLAVVVGRKELARVVTGEAEGHLRQIVRAEGEELCLVGNGVGGQRSARDLDHGADLVGHVGTGFLDDLLRSLVDDGLDEGQLLLLADQRDHDLRRDLPCRTAAADSQRGLDDRGSLHLGDLREGDVQTAAAVAHHGVELMQRGNDLIQMLDAQAHFCGQICDILRIGRDELVQGRVEQADGDRAALHGLIDSLKVGLLDRLELGQRPFALLGRLGDDHLTHGLDAVSLEEHMLGTAQADALCAEGGCLLRVVRGVGVRADLQTAELVGPAHQAVEIAGDGRGSRLDLLAVNIAGGAVDGDPVAFLIGLAGQLEGLGFLVHLDRAAAGDAARAHAAGNDSRVGGHAAADGQNALRVVHTLDILGRGLQTDKHDLMTVLGPVCCFLGGENDLTAGSARRRGQARADDLGLLQGGRIERRVQERIEALRVDHGDGLFLGDHALVYEIAGDLHRGGSGALAVAGLEHIELLVLNGELHILHIAVVIFELGADIGKLLVCLRHDLGQLVDGLRGADAGHDVFTLRVHQELAEQLLFAGGGVAGKRDARAGGIAGIAEDHGLDVDSSAPVGGNIVHAAVVDRAGIVPGAEDGLDGAHQLHFRVLREFLAELVLVFGLELLSQLLEIVGIELGVELHALLFLHLVDELLKILLADLHDNVGVHLDEAAVGVVCKAGIVGFLGKGDDDLVVQAKVQDGVHHAGHGSACAGADGDEQRVVQITELLTGHLLELFDVLHDLGLDLGVDLVVVLIVLRAGLGRDGEALRDRHAEVGHFGQVRALAAEQLAHFAVAFGEKIDVLVRHLVNPFPVLRLVALCAAAMSFFILQILQTNTYYTIFPGVCNLKSFYFR